MFRRILVPLDGSPLAESALPHAAAVAEIYGAEVLLLHVLERERRSGGVAADVTAWDLRRIEAGAYLDETAGKLHARGVRADVAIEEGDGAERILDQIRAREADLLVLTSHGKGGLTEFRVAGTAQKVLSRAAVSVLLVPARDGMARDPRQPLYRTVAAPVDCSPRGENGVNLAAHVARASSAELVLVHVVPVPEMTGRTPLDAADVALLKRVIVRNRCAAERYLAATRARLSAPDHPVRTHVSVARNVALDLIQFIQETRPDLVVVSSHGCDPTAHGSWGSVAQRLLAGADVPLLMVSDALSAGRPERESVAAHAAFNGPRFTARDS